RVSFGPDTPLTDYTVHAIGGGWVNPRTWKGMFNVNSITGDGYQLIRISNAVAADDPWLVNGNDQGRFRFEIVTSGVESLNLQASGGERRVDLSWTQTDFELLAGYNLYRSTSETGTYSRVNSAIIPAQTKQFVDLGVLPGKPYFYKFTVVQTDMSESPPSNIATGTPLDTIPPTISHTAISVGKPGLQVDLAADIEDNVRVTGATLYHRTRGETVYQTRSLVNTAGSRWTVTLEASRIVSPGVEYYISATDGVSTTLSGRPDAPYFIKVDDSPVVTGVSPTQGAIAGGAVVTITGSNFKTGAKVLFGSTPATDLVVVSATQITCKAPANIPAKVSVTVEAADGSRSTLANAFTFLDPNPSLYLPDRSSFTGAIITVPLDIANATGLVAADITVTYASAVLKLRGATAGSLASGWTLLPNTSTIGEVRLSMASGGSAVSGTGTLANLEFEVLGSSGQTSALTITAARLNDGAVTATRIAGSVAVSAGYVISGRVGYWADASRVVTGTTLTLEGAGTVTTTNGSDGTYRFENLQNIAYSVTPAKTTQVEAITAYDAALALRHAVGLTILTGNAAKAADVNLSGEITSMDAYHILRQSAQLEPISVAGAGRAWYFTPDKLTFPALSGSQTGQNFTAILLGDISGNWMSTTGQAGGATVRTGLATVVDSVANRTVVSLLLQAGSVPVRGIDAVLTYATGQSLGGVEVEPELVNSVNGTAAGTVRAALANAEGISGDRVLLALTFSGTTNPQVAIQSLMLDEGAILSAGDADPALFDRNGDGRIDAPGLPRITRQPQAQTLSTGGTDVTFSVSATGSPAPVFQWYRNGVAIANATNTSLTISGVQAAATGLYTVKVSNSAGVVTSTAAALSISQPGNNATHALTGPGYVTGQTLTIANTLTYGGSPSGLRWSVLLPPEWRFASSTAGGASRAPAVNDTGLIEWEWTTAIPASPLTFSYTLSVPSGQAGAKEIAALVGVRSGAETQVLAQPDPLPVAPVTTHSADTDRNYRISLTELTRVIELYNSRNGTTRTGAYGLAETTEDGFAADATRAASVAVSLGRYHTA
ncbi:MAG: IPT/TIG domain-containing protein, partial [Opitutaceae bacterium]